MSRQAKSQERSVTLTDAAARDLITRTGLSDTLFVEAGAGTGKTRALVDRVVNLVVDEGVSLADIAAITFTEAAAAELSDRIRVAFEKRARGTDDPDVRACCETALRDADKAVISTLHSFAARILSEHPLEAGLPPRVGVLDEISSALAHEARWERFVDGLYDEPAHEELLVRALLTGAPLEPRYRGHATMKGVAMRLNQNWDRLDAAISALHDPLPPIDFGPFARAVAALEAFADTCLQKNVDKFHIHLTTTVLPQAWRMVNEADPDRKFRVLQRQQKRGFGRGSGGRDAGWACGIKDAKRVIDDLNEAVRQVVTGATQAVLDRFLSLVSQEVWDAADERRRSGLLEFHDLLVLSRRLLRTSSEARRALHGRYTHLLLDEFQDTDPIQIELAVLIATVVTDGEPPAWHDADVEPGRLFFVGDPKQSIYRFRRADIKLFLEARERFGGNGSAVRLTTNFRTVPPILDWVNGMFEVLMPEVAEAQPRYEPLDPHRTPSTGGDHRPVLLGGLEPRMKAGPLRELEAGSVAAAIDDIRSRPEAWPVAEERDGVDHWRPARLADITILLPTRTSLPFLRVALEELSIPYRLNTGTLVYDTQEVRDALAALRAIDDPTDELSLVAALRSPLYACSDTDLFSWWFGGGRWRIGPTPPEGIDGDHPVAVAMAHLHRLAEQRWWLRPSLLLDQLLADQRAAVVAFGAGAGGGAASLSRAGEVWGRLRFLVDQARAYEESGGGGGLRGFLEWAELQGSESAGVHEPVLPETDDDSVRIMTIHGAKGLEFRITILSGMTTQPVRGRTGVSVVWDGDTPEVRLRKDVGTANHDARADLEAEMDDFEKTRLLYVACTRARDHLLIAAHHVDNIDSYAKRIWETAQELPDRWRVLEDLPGPADREQLQLIQTVAPESAPPVPTGDDRTMWIAARRALLEEVHTGRFISATAIAREATEALAQGAGQLFATAVPVEGDEDADESVPQPAADERAQPVPLRRRGRAGTAVGRAVHATLQFTDLAAPTGVDEQGARQAGLEAVPEAAATVAALVRSALASEAVALAAKSPHHKEVYVAAPVGDRVIEGYVDLLVETDAGLVVIDYKTDTVASEAEVDAKLGHYELQGAAYAVALEQATGLPVVGCRFVFCHTKGAIEREVADLAAAKDRVRRHLDG